MSCPEALRKKKKGATTAVEAAATNSKVRFEEDFALENALSAARRGGGAPVVSISARIYEQSASEGEDTKWLSNPPLCAAPLLPGY